MSCVTAELQVVWAALDFTLWKGDTTLSKSPFGDF